MSAEIPTDPFEMFWDLAASGKLHLQRCTKCSQFRFFPNEYCPKCGDTATIWEELNGSGRLVTWTVVHRSAHARFQALTPYAVGRISLDEQPELKVQAFLKVSDFDELQVGLRMKFDTASLNDIEPSFVFKSVPSCDSHMHEMTER